MKTVSVLEAKTHLSALLEAVRTGGEEVVITRRGEPIARLAPVVARPKRVPGELRKRPGWETFVFDPAVFAPMTEEEMKAEGWPV